MSDDRLANLHRRFYRTPSVAAFYDTKRALYEPETTIFGQFQDELKGSRFLDLGIGAGRTTEHVLALTPNYVGIDYVPEMVDLAQKRFPQVDIRVGDARDLSMFESESFDVVMFSFNGMDTLTEEDRLLILKEVRRLLRPNGLFIFSTHNRTKRPSKPWSSNEFSFTLHPLRFVRHSIYFAQGILNYRATRHEQWETDSRACWLDSGTNYSAPLYFITKQAQAEQLKRIGFDICSVVSRDGSPSDLQTADQKSSWIYFACRRVG